MNTIDDTQTGKYADNQYPIEEVLRRRCSTIAFSDRAVPIDALQSVCEAARWAASSYNEQPWRFLVASRQDTPQAYEALLACLSPHNRQWAQRAPVLMLTAARTHFSHNGHANRHAFHDVGLALGNLIVQAGALGLFLHLAAGFDAERAREAFGVPGEFEPVTIVALGYLGRVEDLPPSLRDRELTSRKRKPLGSLVFTERWGHPAEWIDDDDRRLKE